MSEEYIKEVVLPSKGLFYGDNIPGGVVTIEPMGTREEKLFASGKAAGASLINKVFDHCVHCPIPHLDLVLGDRLFLLLQIRSISYGNIYNYAYRCSECRQRSWASIDLDNLSIRYAPDGASPTFTVKLPTLGNELELRLLTGNDETKVSRYVKQLTARSHRDSSDSEYVYRLARRIESIDGQPAGIRESMELVENLKGRDSLHLRDEIEAHDVGPELEVDSECSNCGFVNGPMIISFESEFFRPRRHSTGSVDHIRTAEVLDASS